MVARMHFCHPALHALAHICPQTTSTGPYAIYSQWPMERSIGNLGGQIHQPSNPYGNLAQRGLHRCQVNAIRAIIPALGDQRPHLPQGAIDLGGGYVLLTTSERYAHMVTEPEAVAH